MNRTARYRKTENKQDSDQKFREKKDRADLHTNRTPWAQKRNEAPNFPPLAEAMEDTQAHSDIATANRRYTVDGKQTISTMVRDVSPSAYRATQTKHMLCLDPVRRGLLRHSSFIRDLRHHKDYFFVCPQHE